MADITNPLRVRHGGNEIYTYELPQRINYTQAYPLLAPNHSSATLHATGTTLTITWRGGAAQKHPRSAFQNGADDNDIVMVDSYGAESQGFPDGQHGDLLSQDHIVAQTSLKFDSIIADVATPHIPHASNGLAADTVPELGQKRLICAVALATGAVYLLALPLSPTRESLSLESCSAILVHQIQCRRLGASHKLALTLRAVLAEATSDEATCDWILAYYTSEPTFSLHVAQIPFDFTTSHGATQDRPRLAKHTHYLKDALLSLSFSMSTDVHAQSQLLLAEAAGTVRICDIAAPVSRSRAKSRRVAELSRSLTWLASFYTPFEEPGSSSTAKSSIFPQRKAVLGAEWAMQGQCVAVLLADGTWGLWDLQNAGSRTFSTRPGIEPASGAVSGGGVTFFTLYGRLGPATVSDAADAQQADAQQVIVARPSDESKLAPMTPNTRKVKQSQFFNEAPRAATKQTDQLGTVPRGGLSVTPTFSGTGSFAFDTVLLWYRETVFAIPNLKLYWEKTIELNRGVRGPLQGPSVPLLQGVSSGGERITSISLLASSINPAIAPQQRFINNILVAAEHRHVLFCPPLPKETKVPTRATEARRLAHQRPLRQNMDLQLLQRGDLDLGSLDRMLDSMDGSQGPPKLNIFGEPEKTRRVGFKAAE